MKNILSIMIIFIVAAVFFSACSKKEEVKSSDQNKNAVEEKVESELIRTGEVNVEKIDVNKDGKVYECPMDWNVIADNGGNCPVCGMKLKEFTIEETKSNLVKSGFKIKETNN